MTVTQLITAALPLVTAFVVLVTAVITFRTRKDVKDVHVLVNSKMTAALQRISQLDEALRNSDIDVPDLPRIPGDEFLHSTDQ